MRMGGWWVSWVGRRDEKDQTVYLGKYGRRLQDPWGYGMMDVRTDVRKRDQETSLNGLSME